MLVSLSKKLPTLTPSQFTTFRVRLREQLPALALIRRLPFGVKVSGIRRESLRHYPRDRQFDLGVKRLLLWRRNAQLFCHPHQVCQRAGLHLLHNSPTLDLDRKFGGPQLSGNLLIE
jgi:hypothetical protein